MSDMVFCCLLIVSYSLISWPAICIHGDKAQQEREWVLEGTIFFFFFFFFFFLLFFFSSVADNAYL